MENQVTQLKLNVTNIKSYLINSNKELGKLRKDKKNLFSKIEKKRELRAEENRLEIVSKIGSGFSKIASTVKAPVVSLFDRILEFFGLIATGVLVQKLPAIVAKIDEFFNSDFYKSLIGFIDTIAKGIDTLFGMSNEVSTKNLKKLQEDKSKIEEQNRKLEKDAAKLKDSEGVFSKIKSILDKIPMTPLAPGSMYPVPTKTKEPQKKASGGTISKDNSPNTQRKSGPLKRAERGMSDGFTGFSVVVNNIEEAVQRDEENVKAFSKMSERFKEWSSVGITTSKPHMPPGQNGGYRPTGPLSKIAFIPGNGKVGGGAEITDPHDPDAEQTGLDIALRDANGNFDIGAIIQNPFTDLKITGTGYQFANGSGYGYYVTGNTTIQGKTYELLVGHLDKIAVKEGDTLKAGDSIGTQGMSGSTSGPHVTTHINDLSGGGNAQAILNSVADAWIHGNIIQSDAVKKTSNGMVATISKPIKPLNTSSNNGNQSVFIYAVQPIETFLPFPYAVPIEKPSPSTSQKSKVPAVWRT